jgi:hypothetical protein
LFIRLRRERSVSQSLQRKTMAVRGVSFIKFQFCQVPARTVQEAESRLDKLGLVVDTLAGEPSVGRRLRAEHGTAVHRRTSSLSKATISLNTPSLGRKLRMAPHHLGVTVTI